MSSGATDHLIRLYIIMDHKSYGASSLKKMFRGEKNVQRITAENTSPGIQEYKSYSAKKCLENQMSKKSWHMHITGFSYCSSSTRNKLESNTWQGISRNWK
jgi:hypothetical protein